MPVPESRIAQAFDQRTPLVMEHTKRGVRATALGEVAYRAKLAEGFVLVWSEPPDHPGVAVHWLRVENGWTKRNLAMRLELSGKTVNLLEAGKTVVTARTAIRLEYVLGEPASFWLGLQSNLDLYEARKCSSFARKNRDQT